MDPIESALQPSNESYTAAVFYERYVDRLSPRLTIDPEFPDFPLSGIVFVCCTNKDAVKKWGAPPHYSQKQFHQLVALWFNTTVKEMNMHWKSFK